MGMQSKPRVFISLGAGVQSSTMALMAAVGELPMPDAAVFADTQAEPAAVYAWLEWLKTQLPYPVHVVTKGSLGDNAVVVHRSKSGKLRTEHAVPAYTLDAKSRGTLMRHCTQTHKIQPIMRKYRELVGVRRKLPGQAEQWLGITTDEAQRMKPSREAWLANRWPLVELGMSRADCITWMRQHGYPKPPRSACVFCPYRSNEDWMSLKRDSPAEFAAAVKFERNFQAALAQLPTFSGEAFLHPKRQSLDTVDFGTEKPTADQFGNECEGMCGV